MSTFASSSTLQLLPRRLRRLPPPCYSYQHHCFLSSSSCPPAQHHGLWINNESRPALNGLTHTLQSPATRQDLGHVVSIAEGTLWLHLFALCLSLLCVLSSFLFLS